MKRTTSIALLLFLSLYVFANDTVIYNQQITLNSDYSDYDDVDVVARDSITLSPGFSFSSGTNSNLTTLLDPWELDVPVQDFAPGTSVEPSGILDGSFVVGTINGQPGVSPSGAATYSIPIAVPAGTRGMAPQLSVSYNSQAGNGIMGRGWNLGGLSSISATGKAMYYDNESSRVSLTDTACRVVWDGQRLFALNSAGLDADSFRTEIQSHAKIDRFGSENSMWFRIKTANGQTLEYGNSTDSRMKLDDDTQWKWMLNKVSDRNGNTMKYTYQNDGGLCEILISKIEYGGSASDPVNEVLFHYDNRSDISYAYIHDDLIVNNKILDSISMKSNDSYTGSYGFHFDSSMNETLLDEIVQYDKDNNRFNATSTSWEQPVFSISGTTTTLNISSGTNYQYFTGDFTGDGYDDLVSVKLNLTTDDVMYYLYKGSSTGISANANESGQLPYSITRTIWDDLVDSIDEECPSVIPTAYYGQADVTNIFSGDFDGDGIEELYIKTLEWDTVANHLPAELPIGSESQFLADLLQEVDICSLSGIVVAPQYEDINYGIGKLMNFDKPSGTSDRITAFRLGDKVEYDIRNSQLPDMAGLGYSFFPDNSKMMYYNPKNDTALSYCNLNGDQQWAEFDGDGLPDYLEVDNDSFDLKTFDPLSTSFSLDTTIKGDLLGTIDLNGDGIHAWVSVGEEQFETKSLDWIWDQTYDESVDIMSGTIFIDFIDFYEAPDYDFRECGVDNAICRENYLSTQTGNWSIGRELYAKHLDGHGPRISLETIDGSTNPYTRSISADINADGNNELLVFEDDELTRIFYDFIPSYSNGAITYTFTKYECTLSLGENTRQGDFNGDGIVEFLFPNGSSSKHLTFISSGKPGIKMASFSNGLGVETRYTYKPLSDTSVYTRGTDTDYPVVDLTPNWYVVSSIASDNGVADSSYVEYDYGGAKIHLQGKGFLGFMETSVKNISLNTLSNSVFDYDTTYFHPYPISSEQLVGSTPVMETSNYTSINNVSGLTFSVQTDSVVVEDLLTGVTKESALSYNGNGLLSEKKVSVSTQEFVTEEYSYTSAGWHVAVLPEYVTTTYDRGGFTETDSSVFSYSSSTGNLTQKIKNFGTDRAVTLNISGYDSFGNPTRTSLATKRGLNLSVDSIVSTMSYDADGRFLLRKNAPHDFKESFEYDYSTGQLESSTSANRTETNYQYGPFNRLKETNHPDLMKEASDIFWVDDHSDAPADALFYRWAVASGSPPVLAFYDVMGRELRTVTSGYNGEDIYIDTEYDSKGRIAQKSVPYFSDDTPLLDSIQYDSFGRIIRTRKADSTETVYDYNDLETTITVSKESDTVTTRSEMNAWGELAESGDNIGNVVHYKYFPDGKLKQSYINRHEEQKTLFTYDAQGNRTSITDPDAGTIHSLYDGFGKMVRQINAKGDTSTFVYDKIGRVTSSTDERGSMFYSYISDSTSVAFGSPDSIYNGDKSLQEIYQYDSEYGRLLSETKSHLGKTFTNTFTYDWFGRPFSRTYPSGFEVQYSYSSYGDLQKVTGGGFTLWNCSDVNALGQITSYSQGSFNTSLNFDMHGVLSQVTTGSIVNMIYKFDDMGNLSSREDVLTHQKEVFEYDKLNRLTGIEYHLVNVHQTSHDFAVMYDNCGNITSKTGVSSSILYGEDAGPHALTTIETPVSSYKPPPQGISYTSFNKVETISDTLTGGIPLKLDFSYGLGNQRIKTVQKRNGTIEKVKYFNGDYEEDSTSVGLKKYHYIQGGNGLTAIFVMNGSDNDTMYYVLSDHLGSITGIVNASTSAVENYSFSAWGMPRDASDWTQSYTGDLFAGRGFTGHEHLQDFSLINMNGRVYDPVLGRFLSPDPFVQAPGYPNSFNRYSYVLNNPLKFVDPSGYSYQQFLAAEALNDYNPQSDYYYDYINGGGAGTGDYNPFYRELGSSRYAIDASNGFYRDPLTMKTHKVEYDYVRGKYYHRNQTGSSTFWVDGEIYVKPLWGQNTYLDENGIWQNDASNDGVYGPGDLVYFDNGVGIKYDLQDGVGIRSSAQVSGHFSIDKSGKVVVSAQVFHGEKQIQYSYNGNVRFRLDGQEDFYQFVRGDNSFLHDPINIPLGYVYYTLPESGVVTMDIYIGYEVDTGTGYFNGDYYQGSFLIGR